MTSGQKTAFSLLITVLIFTVLTVFSFTGGFKFVETRFYQPKIISGINSQLDKISSSLDQYLDTAKERFENYKDEDCVKSFVQVRPSQEDVKNRSKLTGDLFSQTTGLSGIRVIDKNARAIHYSTFDSDLLKRNNNSVSYSNYDEKLIEFSKLSSYRKDDANKDYSINFDSTKNQFIISFPFYDTYSVNRGVIVFYLDCADFTRFLTGKNLISLSDKGFLVVSKNGESDQSGIVFGIPSIGSSLVEKAVCEKWSEGLLGTEPLLESESGDWILLSNNKSTYAKIGWVFNENAFIFPRGVKVLLLVCIFITLFLIIFMLFNLRRDDMVVIRERIRKFQLSLLTEYVDNKSNADWAKISSDIAFRKQEVNSEIKKSLGSRAKKHSKEVDALLDRSWNEILSAMGANNSTENASISLSEKNTQQLKAMLEDVLSKGNISVKAIASEPSKIDSISKAEERQQLEEVEDAEVLEDLQEVEDLNEVDDVEAVEDLQEVEELNEADDAEAVEDLQEVEELDQADDAEELEDAEDVDEAKEVVDAGETEDDSDKNKLALHPIEHLNDFVNTVNKLNESNENSIDLSEKTQFGTISFPHQLTAEEEAAVENFTISSLDFSSLDDFIMDEERYLPVSHAVQESESPAEKIEAEQFVNKENKNENKKKKDGLLKRALKSSSKKSQTVKQKGLLAAASKVERTVLKDATIVQPVEDKKSSFNFTTFGAYKKEVEELKEEKNAIVENQGVFSIAEDLNVAGLTIDPEFKKLVDSVVKH